VRAYATANPDITFTMVSQPMMEPLFTGIPNLRFFSADFKNRYKNFKGLITLFKDLYLLNPTHIADLHNVLRTWVLRGLFAVCFKKISFLHKGRKEKKNLTRKDDKILVQLPTMISRYESVLVKQGLQNLNFSNGSELAGGSIKKKLRSKEKEKGAKIGIAPFAKHKGKEWPLQYMEEVVAQLCEEPGNKIFLFGGGKSEIARLQAWEQKYSGIELVAGKYSLKKEIEIINDLDLMITMDSANMHLASFTGTQVLSVWGATHPFAGFYGWGQSQENAIQLDLECRPCSVFGNKECFRGDYACLNNINPKVVLDKIHSVLKESNHEN
jgi:ADP-heptose:LPS heptosyltransferase